MKYTTTLIICFSLSLNCILAQQILPADSNSTNKVSDSTFNNSVIRGILIESEDFNQGAVFHPLQLIQGKVPGFQINNLSAMDPNPELEIQTRGPSTFHAQGDVLYIIDGIPAETAYDVPVQSIESIRVLRKLSETAPYGIRGSKGVVIITTKQYGNKKFNLSYNTYAYIERFSHEPEYMNANEWNQLKEKWASSDNSRLQYNSERMNDYGDDTDWREEISQQKISQSQHIHFDGFFNKTSYGANLTYNNHNGIIQKTKNTIYNGQIFLKQLAFKDKLQINLNLNHSTRYFSEINDNPYLNANNPIETNIITTANQYNPTVPSYAFDTNAYDYYDHKINPLQKIQNSIEQQELNSTTATIEGEFQILNGLNISSYYSIKKK